MIRGNMSIEFDNNIPIYLQIVEQIKIDIVSGNLELGSRMLSVRELALKLKVNPNTIQRALGELEDMGLIFTERTNGKYVTSDRELIDKYKIEYADKLSKEYYTNMKKIGFSDKEISIVGALKGYDPMQKAHIVDLYNCYGIDAVIDYLKWMSGDKLWWIAQIG